MRRKRERQTEYKYKRKNYASETEGDTQREREREREKYIVTPTKQWTVHPYRRRLETSSDVSRNVQYILCRTQGLSA